MKFKTVGVAMLACLGLAGCQLALPAAGVANSDHVAGQTSVRLASSDLILTAPDGFCVDQNSVKDTQRVGFVMMADCAALHGTAAQGASLKLVMLTASVSAPLGDATSLQSQTLAQFFETTEGRAVLSRSGDPSQVSANASVLSGDILVLRASDTSPTLHKGLAQDESRVIVIAKGRLVSLTGIPLIATHAARNNADALVIELARQLKADNSDS